MPQGTTLTTLYDLGKSSPEDFDEFRHKRGLAPYFHCAEDLSIYAIDFHYGPYLDQSDLDDLDHAFLLGAQAVHQEGIRLPWPYPRFVDHPHRLAIQNAFESYTLWPQSHILIPVPHALLAFMREVFAHCEGERFLR